eukprot:scaffold56_cov379-Prasinococcus_capsulatus_cf.AAC.15
MGTSYLTAYNVSRSSSIKRVTHGTSFICPKSESPLIALARLSSAQAAQTGSQAHNVVEANHCGTSKAIVLHPICIAMSDGAFGAAYVPVLLCQDLGAATIARLAHGL